MKGVKVELKVQSNINDDSKLKRNNLFKYSLILISFFVVIFLIIGFIFLIINGSKGFISGDSSGNVASFPKFILGNYYSLQTFSSGFMLINSLYTTLIAVLISVPISVFTALFITRIAPLGSRKILSTLIIVLAAIPSVVYGAFGKQMLDPLITSMGAASGSVISISLMLALMIMPTITLITTATINSVDKKMEQSSLALGATKMQTSFKVTLRASVGGIIVGTLLGIGRALGEATAVSLISSPSNYGPTWDLTENIRLLTATMLKGFYDLSEGTLEYLMVFSQAVLLMVGIVLIFIGMKYAQKITNQDYRVKKQQEKTFRKTDLITSAQENYWELNTYEKFKYSYLMWKMERHEKKRIKEEYEFNRQKISSFSSVRSIESNSKKRNSIFSVSWVSLFASIGIVLFVSLLIFLFSGGFSVLNWNLIAGRGVVETIPSGTGTTNIFGLAVPIIGTILSVLLSLLIATPLGVLMGIYFSIYSKKNSKISKIISFSVDLLTGIPSLIFGLIAAIMFIPMARAINFMALAGALIMAIVTLPTIIRVTQQSIEQLPKTQLQGSLALGATHSSSSLRILVPQVLPSIISGIILSAGRILGESAIFIVVFGTWQRSNTSEWLTSGGTTLATEIYKLTSLEIVPWQYVKAISIVIIMLILLLSIFANQIEAKRKYSSILMGIGMLLIIWGISTYIIAFFWLGITIFFLPILWNFSKSITKKRTNYLDLIQFRIRLIFKG